MLVTVYTDQTIAAEHDLPPSEISPLVETIRFEGYRDQDGNIWEYDRSFFTRSEHGHVAYEIRLRGT